MYRTIDSKIYDDPKVKQLDPEGKLFLIYLITNRHSHVSGIYYLPDCLVLHETGLSQKKLNTLWHTLSSLGMAYREVESETVFVRKMMYYQGRGEKNLRSAANHIKTLHQNGLVKRFIDQYPEIKQHGIAYPIIYPIHPKDVGATQYQEQEQDKEQEQNIARSDSDESSSHDDPIAILIPLSDKTEFEFLESKKQKFAPLFPGVDMDGELRKMRAWCLANPTKCKTRRGVMAFIERWLSRAQDKQPAKAEAERNTDWILDTGRTYGQSSSRPIPAKPSVNQLPAVQAGSKPIGFVPPEAPKVVSKPGSVGGSDEPSCS